MPATPRIVYQHGDHVRTLFSSAEEQLSASVGYSRQRLLDEAPGSDELADYEALLNPSTGAIALGLCQYSRRRLPAAILDHGMATDPTIRIAGPILWIIRSMTFPN